MIKTKFTIILFLLFTTLLNAQKSGYIVDDFHQHTTYSDGWYSMETMMYMNNKFGLDWWATNDHGGGFPRDGRGPLRTNLPHTLDTVWNSIAIDAKWWDSYQPNPIIGTNKTSYNHQVMWRWQSLRDFQMHDVLNARNKYKDKVIILGYEWNMPGHEHCTMGIISNQFDNNPNANPMAEFEYKFDNSDTDTTGGKLQGWAKSILTGHNKALEAAKWLQQKYPKTSYIIPAHPERKSLYKIEDFRDLNSAAPDVCFGFESMPGHQKGPARGEYSPSSKSDGGCTYGGTGIYAAKVGGLWDALLGEGRRWWLFASSDCHSVGTDELNGPDFWPGQYQKTFTYVSDKTNPQAIIDGLRSGNSWVVTGDLIDSLDFTVNGAKMGEYAKPINGNVTIIIKVRDPQKNNNNIFSEYKNPVLNHIDLIAGKVTGRLYNNQPGYNDPTNPTTKVIARFDAVGGIKDGNNIISQKWEDKGNGWKEMSITLTNVTDKMYFRLRGTNHGLNVPNETDINGNPLPDTLIPATAATAFADLWFYSNPIFCGENITDVKNEYKPNNEIKTYKLEQNYPNPFNPSTTIEYYVPTNSHVNISIYDINGKKVKTLVNEIKNKGNYKINFDASDLSSGVYYYTIKGNNFSKTMKMNLLK